MAAKLDTAGGVNVQNVKDAAIALALLFGGGTLFLEACGGFGFLLLNILQDELITAVRRAVVSLPEPERQAVIAYYWQGQRVDRVTKSKALRLLRRPEVSRRLWQFWR